MSNNVAPKGTKKEIAREIWLHYLNRYLLDHGVITDKEYSQMRMRIMVSHLQTQ